MRTPVDEQLLWTYIMKTVSDLQWHVQVNYWPSKVEKTAEDQQPRYAKTHISKEQISGVRVKEDLYVGDDYKQAGDRIRSMDPDRYCSPFFSLTSFPGCAPTCL
jgi:hypothetical protein